MTKIESTGSFISKVEMTEEIIYAKKNGRVELGSVGRESRVGECIPHFGVSGHEQLEIRVCGQSV